MDILCASQLQFGPRNHNGKLELTPRSSGTFREYFMMNQQDKAWIKPSQLLGPAGHFECSRRWKQYAQRMQFFKLLKILRGGINLNNAWKENIRDTTILVGQSQQSNNLAQAFLWNMIAIETLLAHPNDTYSKSLPERISAFIGWSSNWEIQNYQVRIEELYSERCKLVHDGKMELISKEDLLFSDHLILNALYNVVAHINLFKSKDDLIVFSEKIKADKILDIKTKVTPKTVIHWGQPNFKPEDLNI